MAQQDFVQKVLNFTPYAEWKLYEGNTPMATPESNCRYDIYDYNDRLHMITDDIEEMTQYQHMAQNNLSGPLVDVVEKAQLNIQSLEESKAKIEKQIAYLKTELEKGTFGVASSPTWAAARGSPHANQ